ncbi:XRE family transcriptional regulator [Salmonella enterica subsp. enterica serovar Newport]|nr:XRE family transcriptional regulator [Salmonella enterica subsp. enterica serovar Newport]ECC3382309.1 XRE family transcriptional regulator [Salmonella enterica subsp. enterica serovar Manchester]EDG5395803.1 helix-turn-helix domain-containing protein [Salmonella enterica subsp. enterica serovar Bovismorbificans]EKP4774452.1 helix-turn-helix transcriptional regulator [Salmonella enterica]ECA5183337.1 XRE family transcriptional regulator [Salmonella enterica subsp. enterica serovar Newport]
MKNSLKRSGYADKSANKQLEKERIIEQMSIIRFGERLKSAMEESGLNYMSLSKLSGLSEATVRKYAQGKIFPGIDSAALVAHACGVSLEWLISGKSATEDNNPHSVQSGNTELNLLLQRMSAQDVDRLLDAFYNIGIKGVLERLQPPLEHPENAKTAIRSLNIRESLKEAFCMALEGNEETDREILRRIESRNRARSPGDHTAATPEPHNNTVTKKQA